MRGRNVANLQNALASRGYLVDDRDIQKNYYGKSTRDSVTRLQTEHGVQASGAVDGATAKLLNRVLNKEGVTKKIDTGKRLLPPIEPKPKPGKKEKLLVKGRVVEAAGRLVAGANVKAFAEDLQGSKLMARAVTGSDGCFECVLDVDLPFPDGKEGIDLRVAAYDAKERELATSPILFNVESSQTIDLVSGGENYRGPSEFERMVTAIGSSTRYSFASKKDTGVSIAELDPDEEHRDVSYLSGKTGLPSKRVSILILAHRLAKELGLAPEIVYGFIREGLPTQLSALVRVSPDVQRFMLEVAVQSNVVPAHIGRAIDKSLEKLRQFVIKNALEKPKDADTTTLVQLIGIVLPGREKQEAFVAAYIEHRGSVEEFWKSLETRPEFEGQVRNLEWIWQLGVLVGYHIPLVQELDDLRRAGEVASLTDLVRFNEKKWLRIVRTTGVPTEVTGKNEKEKHLNFSRILMQRLEDRFLTPFVTQRMKEDDLEGRKDMVVFLSGNPEFDLRTTRLESYLAKRPEAMRSIADVDGTKRRIKGMVRLLRIAPRYALASTLAKNRFDSAHSIALMGENTFISKYGQTLGGSAIAKVVYERAVHVQATALNLLVRYGPKFNNIPIKAWSDLPPGEVDGVPEWSTLFGSIELSKCQECRSVHSPAAYLVDVLHFLSHRNSKIEGRSARDILFDRRPDIGEIELDCGNTNTVLSYVDLVNEALENAVSPFSPFGPFDLPAQLEADLNSRKLSEALTNAFVPPLSAEDTITVGCRGESSPVNEPWWTIDEPAFTYRLCRSNSRLRVVSRSLQTKGSRVERAANPQYVNAGAYELLRKQTYPWVLPFNMWEEETQIYLEHLGVPRHQIMETFLPGGRVAILNNSSVAHCYLGLTSEEAKIITGAVSSQSGTVSPGPWNMWGFETETLNAQNSIPDPSDSTRRIASGNWLSTIRQRVDVLLQQSGLSYDELRDVLGTYFVNPFAANVQPGTRTIQITPIDSASSDTCETDKLQLAGLDSSSQAARIMRFVRLLRRLGWSMHDLDKAITALEPAELNDLFLIQLSHIQRLHTMLNVPILNLLSWWAPIDSATYVDNRAPGRPQIPSLYAQLFRNKAVITPLDIDFPEDADELGASKKISEHIAAISSALCISSNDLRTLASEPRIIPRILVSQDPKNTVIDDRLTLDCLSRLYRHATLAKALRLPIRDYCSVLEIVDSDPFATTAETVLFVEEVLKLRASPFSIDELRYLLRHRFDLSSGVGPNLEAVALVLDEIRIGLQQIAYENSFNQEAKDGNVETSEPRSVLLRKKLALLDWDGTLIDEVMATIGGSVTYVTELASLPTSIVLPNAGGDCEVDLVALPSGFEMPAELSGKVAYDPVAKKLRASVYLSKRARDLLFDASHDPSYETAVKALFDLQDGLMGEVSYDQDKHKLRFKGPMTLARRARLESESPDDEYRKAIASLFDSPRKFIARCMRIFSVQSYSADIDIVPEDVMFPSALRRRVYFDEVSNPKHLHFVGVMTEQDYGTLYALSAETRFRSAIDSLYNAPSTWIVGAGDVFLSDRDSVDMFDQETTEEARYLLVLDKLLPYLRQTLGERFVAQKIAEAMKLEARIAEELLKMWIYSPGNRSRKSITEFVPTPSDSSARMFAESNPRVKLDPEKFRNQFGAYVLLHKAACLIGKFKITPKQLVLLFKYGPSAGWLDFNSLPTKAEDPSASFNQLLRLVDLFGLRDELSLQESAIPDLFEMAHDANASRDELLQQVSSYTKWNITDLEFLLGAGGFGLTFPDPFRDERALVRLRESFLLLARLGMSAEKCRILSSADVGQVEARCVKQAAKAKHDKEGWLDLAKPLRDVLREKQRATLVAYLVSHLRLPLPVLEFPHPELVQNAEGPAVRELQQKLCAFGVQPEVKIDGVFGSETLRAVVAFQGANNLTPDGIVGPTTWSVLDNARHGVRDVNDLYAHLLIDVEMDPCMMTSRIKQAISSVQLFVQRCLMDLEPEVVASAGTDAKWLEWEWMKNYRVWEANRKIFLYPENWIEPELRDDKSPFFKELESELLQSDLTDEAAELAFKNYLAKLDQVARLEVVGMYHELEDESGNAVVDVLHVFGRTYGTPHVYYYRQLVNGVTWTAWERVDLDIQGDHLLPLVWNRRLHLFWLVFTERPGPDTKPSSSADAFSAPTTYWDVQLAWSERKQTKWTNRRISRPMSVEDDSLQCPGDDVAWMTHHNPSGYFLRSFVDQYNHLYMFLLVAECEPYYGPDCWIPAFRFDGVSTDPELLIMSAGIRQSVNSTRIYDSGAIVESVTGTTFFDTMLMGTSPSGPVYLPTPTDTMALARTPSAYKLLPPHEGSSISRHPFFYQDSSRTFFVISEDKRCFWPDISQIYTPILRETNFGKVGLANTILRVGSSPKTADVVPLERSFPVGPRLSAQVLADNREGAHQETLKTILRGTSIREGDTAKSGSRRTCVRRTLCEVEPTDEAILSAMSPGGSKAATPSSVLSAVSEVLPDSYAAASIWHGFVTERSYRFGTFYHPYVHAFVRELNRDGVDGLLRRKIQIEPSAFLPPSPSGQVLSSLNFLEEYGPGEVSYPIVVEPYPSESVDFENGPYSSYNWELFFHVPLMMADRLYKNQRFEEAQKWFHYIFDPTDASSYSVPQRYWRTKPFFYASREDFQRESIQNLLRLLAIGGDLTRREKLSASEKKQLTAFENSVAEWRNHPFNPHLVARMRLTSYPKTVVMKYIDNLIAWGDSLFRRETIESINEATQLYVLAAEILGRRPEILAPSVAPRTHTYNTLEPKLDEFSNALEDLVSASVRTQGLTTGEESSLGLPSLLCFCVPNNDTLIAYWGTVADRLFKIRHCMNIEGVVRQLPLFEPPIEPGLLVRARAAGIDISSVLNDINTILPHYRFSYVVQKANELCSELKSLGASLLSALEKRDAEQLSLIRAEQETNLLNMVESVKLRQYDEAVANQAALRESRDMAAARYLHYQKLLGVQSPRIPAKGDPIPDQAASRDASVKEESGVLMIQREKKELESLRESNKQREIASWIEINASVAHAVPNWNIQPWGIGATFGGSNVGSVLSAVANYYSGRSAQYSYEGTLASRLAQYVMRAHDWTLQSNLAAKEIMQIDRQLVAAEIREDMADQDLTNHRRQIENARQVENIMRSKYTNQDLYNWMVGQISGMYFRAYQLAYDVAKRAEHTYRYELGLEGSSFVRFGYWDSLKKGLLAGEQLQYDLKRLEVAYLEKNMREFEITKHISLALLDPIAFTQLKQTGECLVTMPEAIFDLDCPGHYMRRIKSVSLSVPCVAGPYTGVNCTIKLLNSSVRRSSALTGGRYCRLGDEDPRFSDLSGAIQSIVTSSGQNDSGLFETNLRDERYLPFEGAGVISLWCIQLPKDFRHFDYDTISDIVMHLRYTAREGGEQLKQQSISELLAALNELTEAEGRKGLALLLSLRHDFPNEWTHCLNSPADGEVDQILTMNIDKPRLPFVLQDRTISVDAFELFVKVRPEFEKECNESSLKVSLETGTDASANLLSLDRWNGLLHATKTLTPAGEIGQWTLTAWLLESGSASHKRLGEDMIDDVLVVCHYSI